MNDILEFLDTYINLYETLIKLSEDMYPVVIRRDLDGLLEITNDQSDILKKIFSLSNEFTERYGEDFDSLIMQSTLEEKNIINEKIRYLGELIIRLSDLVKINSRVLEQSMGLLNSYIEVFKKNLPSGPIFLEDRG